MLCFKPTFSHSSFTFIKRLFSSSLLSAIRVVASEYLRLLIFLLAILNPACASSSPVFLTMYSQGLVDVSSLPSWTCLVLISSCAVGLYYSFKGCALVYDLEGWDGAWREAKERRDIYIYMTDLHCCMVETNTTL